MNKSTINLPENTIFEVLVTTTNNQKPHTKPFGMKIQDKQVVLTLFPNKTLNNIKNNNASKNIYFKLYLKENEDACSLISNAISKASIKTFYFSTGYTLNSNSTQNVYLIRLN